MCGIKSKHEKAFVFVLFEWQLADYRPYTWLIYIQYMCIHVYSKVQENDHYIVWFDCLNTGHNNHFIMHSSAVKLFIWLCQVQKQETCYTAKYRWDTKKSVDKCFKDKFVKPKCIDHTNETARGQEGFGTTLLTLYTEQRYEGQWRC